MNASWMGPRTASETWSRRLPRPVSTALAFVGGLARREPRAREPGLGPGHGHRRPGGDGGPAGRDAAGPPERARQARRNPRTGGRSPAPGRPPPVLSLKRGLRALREAGQGCASERRISRPLLGRRCERPRPKPIAALPRRRGGLRGGARRPRPRPAPSAQVRRRRGAPGDDDGHGLRARRRRRNRQRHLPRVRDGQRSRDDLRRILGNGGPQHLRARSTCICRCRPRSTPRSTAISRPRRLSARITSSRDPSGSSRRRCPCRSGAISGPCSKPRDTTRRPPTSGRRPSSRPSFIDFAVGPLAQRTGSSSSTCGSLSSSGSSEIDEAVIYGFRQASFFNKTGNAVSGKFVYSF